VKACPHIEAVFEILGRKWNGRIVHYLSTCPGGVARFSEIESDVGVISPRALSLKLAELIGFDLIEKQSHEGSPATVSYVLTRRGWTLVEAMKPLQQWARDQMPATVIPTTRDTDDEGRLNT